MIPFWLRRRARRSPLLLNLYLRYKGLPQLAVHPGRTEICIEAYPRSANSSSFRKFMIANPDAVVEFIRARMDGEGKSRHVRNMPLPTAERTSLKESFLAAVESDPLYPEAQEIYRRLRPQCVAPAGSDTRGGPPRLQ